MEQEATKAKFELLNDIHSLISFSAAKNLVGMTGTEDETIYSQENYQATANLVPHLVKEFLQVLSQGLKTRAHLL